MAKYAFSKEKGSKAVRKNKAKQKSKGKKLPFWLMKGKKKK